MGLQTYNDFVCRQVAGYNSNEPIFGEQTTATTTLFTTPNNLFTTQRCGTIKTFPSLPSGVTSFIPTSLSVASSTSNCNLIAGKLVDLGSLNIATPTFTDGDQMPTVTELGSSVQVASAILVEVTTALNATPGSITVTYKDQDNNSAETTTSHTLGASAVVGSVGLIQLNAGDWGAIDITTATRTGGTTPSGILRFWGIIPLCVNPLSPNTANFVIPEDFISTGTNPLKLANGDILGVFITDGTAKSVFGFMNVIGDN